MIDALPAELRLWSLNHLAVEALGRVSCLNRRWRAHLAEAADVWRVAYARVVRDEDGSVGGRKEDSSWWRERTRCGRTLSTGEPVVFRPMDATLEVPRSGHTTSVLKSPAGP